MKIAVYPGSFDPVTLGHLDIIRRIRPIFDELVVLVANAADKEYLFSADERKELIEKALLEGTPGGLEGVRVDVFDGLTVEYLRKSKARVIIRGIRAVADFEYELVMANMNKSLAPNIETMVVFASPHYHYVSSRVIKEVAALRGDTTDFIPEIVDLALKEKLSSK